MNKNIHFKYWTDEDHAALQQAQTFVDLRKIALDIVHRFPGNVHMVSGPISTGGVGSLDGNRKVFTKVIEILANELTVDVFSQMPFEDKMAELVEKWRRENSNEKYCMPILLDFYEQLFSERKVGKLHFIHGWQSSYGATWEHDNCDRWGIERDYLSKELSLRALVE